MKFTINRSKWWRGQGSVGSWLLRDDGRQCCVGLFLSACGVPDDRLHNMSVAEHVTDSPEWLKARGTIEQGFTTADRLYETNDNPSLSEAAREKSVVSYFARHGVEVEFIDGTPLADPGPPPGGGS